MKKLVFSIGLCLTVGFSSMAQDFNENNPALTSKRGVALLPVAGNFALGIDATTPLTYLGNFFSNASNSAPVFDGFNGNIYGKYFLEDNRALRARLSLNLSTTAQKAFVRDDDKPSETNYTLQDVRNHHYAKVDLGVGYEFRRGSGRIQGFYGGEAILGFSASAYKYDYANSMTSSRTSPSTASFSNPDNGNNSSRVVKQKAGNTFSIGVGGFVGVEYFIAPKLSIGSEFNLRLKLDLADKSETTTESWNAANSKVETKTTKGNTVRNALSVKLNTKDENARGVFFLMFHF